MNVSSGGSNSLWFYQWFERLGWPRSYFGKVFLIAFIANHFPLLCFIVYLLFDPGNAASWITVLLLVLATLAGTTLVFWAWHQLLEPVLLAKQALAGYLAHGQAVELPTCFGDEVGLLLNHVVDIIQRFERSRLLLEQIATEDLLTGLPTQRAADRQLQQSLSLGGRQQLPIGIALLSIDNFKRVNDRYGDAAGDQVLVQLAAHFKDTLRGGDWVARWEGDQFLVVIFADRNGTRIALERIRSEIANLNVTVASAEIKLTVSIGFTMARGALEAQACLERAQIALSQARQGGRNRVKIFTTPA